MALPVRPGSLDKNVQPSFKSVPITELPSSAIVLEALKPLESHLLHRKLIGKGGMPNAPLWFLAETERNVFLWRNGMSLADQDKFEFWIEIPHLVTRRQEQLRHSFGDPEFGNPFIGEAQLTPHTLQTEIEYLDELKSSFARIYMQAFELSLISRTMRTELMHTQRPIILLPREPQAKRRTE